METKSQRELFSQGAEAKIYKEDGFVVKVRPKKLYRHEVLDKKLRKSRTRKEAKVLGDLTAAGIAVPKLIRVDDKEGIIMMEYVEGEKLRDVLDNDPSLAQQAGSLIAKMHDLNTCHGDVTTSNMILSQNNIVVLIDFGLAFSSTRVEDAAVDIHLFKQALTSKHHLVKDKAWSYFLKGYQPKKRDEILTRLRVVEGRGRNKHG